MGREWSGSEGKGGQWREREYKGRFVSLALGINAAARPRLFDNAKKSFYRSFNAIFGKTGRIAPENVVMRLIKSKCVPVLLYAVDACPTNRTLESPLQFPLTRIMMKIFKTNSKEIMNNCQLYFGLQPISDAIKKRKSTSWTKFLPLATHYVNYLYRLLRLSEWVSEWVSE